MGTDTVEQVQKRLYKNNTGGYLGVVILDHKGEEIGVNVEPHGTIWLSDAEAILTSRAPRRPEDNPFEAQMFVTQDPETQARQEVSVRPLELVKGDTGRYVPTLDRYVPHAENDEVARAEAVAAATAAEPSNVTLGASVAARSAEIEATRPLQRSAATAPEPIAAPPSTGSETASKIPPPTAPTAPISAPTPPVRSEPAPQRPTTPAQALGGTSAPANEEEAQSWVEPPQAPGQVLAGALSGEDGVPPEAAAAAAPDPTQGVPGDVVHSRPESAPQTPGAVEEEHAAVDPAIGEETGAARPPAAPPPEGEYGSAEEVGSPEAPSSGDDGATLVGG